MAYHATVTTWAVVLNPDVLYFYSHYANETLSFKSDSYDLPLAYFLVFPAMLLLIIVGCEAYVATGLGVQSSLQRL